MESEQLPPEGWCRVKVRDVFESWSGATPSTSNPDYWNGSIPWVSSKDVKLPRLSDSQDHITQKALNETRLRLTPKGSVLVVVRSGILRHILPVTIADVDVAINQDLKAFHSPVQSLNEWLAIVLRARSSEILRQNRKDGTTVQSIGAGNLNQLEIDIPPLAERRRIVARLEAMLADIERVRPRLDAVAATMQRFRQAVLAAAFSGNLTAEWRRAQDDDIETSAWVLSTISAVGLVSGGLTKNRKRSEYNTRIPYLRVANVYADQLVLSEVEDIGVDANELPRILLKKGDLLIVEGNGSLEQIGRVALWNGEIDPCVHQNHIIKIRFSEAVDRRFALYWLLSPEGRQAITDVATSTSGLHTLSISKVENLPIPLPPLAEQHEIVHRVDALFALADRIEGGVAGARERVAALREAVLAKAFRGELVPTEAELARREGREREPADALLERVRAGRTVSARSPPRRKGAGTLTLEAFGE